MADMGMADRQDRLDTVVALVLDLRLLQVLVLQVPVQRKRDCCFRPDHLNYTVEYTLYSHLRV